MADLPPGDSFLGAVTDIDPDDWQSPALLDQLVPTSVKVTIGEGEKKMQDLQLGRPRVVNQRTRTVPTTPMLRMPAPNCRFTGVALRLARCVTGPTPTICNDAAVTGAPLE